MDDLEHPMIVATTRRHHRPSFTSSDMVNDRSGWRKVGETGTANWTGSEGIWL
ncbi:hypothetical protein [Roseobacter denitrificans]|uniref:Uncharacterized protein n=1 Tax=Roseobacter denitrificans (strain ATCC 33942 / OCh 114) TaxID=375451 RepID=Q167L5_ROSDO|nr:hypothetical protein [Roseobacter denitrificans]ABG31828.1 hypothetical protein RD1_2238 [Roseobacter denitrificans OCh 114]